MFRGFQNSNVKGPLDFFTVTFVAAQLNMHFASIQADFEQNTVKPFNLAALNFSVLPFDDILAAL